MSRLRLSTPALLLFLGSALAPALRAQWASIAYNVAKPLITEKWFVAHDPGSGIQAYSAIAQTWTQISAAGVNPAFYCDSALVTNEGGSLRGWSAFSNSSSTQAVSPSFGFQVSIDAGTSYGVLLDNAPFTNGVLRAYSAYTNSWSSVALSALQSNSVVWGANVAVQKDGLHYRAYSAYTGQWVTLDVALPAGNPFVGTDYAAVDLRGSSGPFQYAAFSALRGTWTLSPVYPASGAGQLSYPSAAAFAIKTDIGVPGAFRYTGYSPYTGQWTTSALTHSTSSTQDGLARWNLVRVQDSDANARFEIFGAGNGIWQSLTGTGLSEQSLHEDFQLVVKQDTSSTIYAASALVGGGYTSISIPSFFTTASLGSRGCLVHGGADLSTYSVWGYSAATNTFSSPVPFPQGSGSSMAGTGAVWGINLQGSAGINTTGKAFSARSAQWVDGPGVDVLHGWTSYAVGATAVLMRADFSPAGYFANVFDEHSNTWKPAPALMPSFQVSSNDVLMFDAAAGDYWAFSAQRGDWTLQTGIGAITSAGGLPKPLENLVSFTDSNNKLWVFATPDRTQSWFQWPAAAPFATSGATPGGSTPYVGVSVRGTPSSEFALVYASTALSPLAIPGFTGVLDLSIGSAFQLANLGVVDADGVREARVAIPAALPPSTQAWMQAVTIDLGSGQAGFAGRATGVRFF